MMKNLMTLDKAVINSLLDGIVLLDKQGVITDLNHAAHPFLKQCIENQSHIRDWVADASKGNLSLPAEVDLFDAGDDSSGTMRKITLCLNGLRGFALVIQRQALAEGEIDPGGADVVPLIGAHMQAQLRSTAELLHCFVPTGLEAEELRKQARYLEAVLQEIAALAELRGRDEIFSEDRFLLASVVRDLLPRLPRQSGTEAISYVVDDGNSNQGAIYGNRGWLTQALHTLMLRLADGCPPSGQVRVELRQIGDYIVMVGNFGAKFPSLFQPSPLRAFRGSDLKLGGISMEICRRIIELHGGQMRLKIVSGAGDENEAASAALGSFTLTLPTGIPEADRSRVSCAECRITFQAMQYARDLAEMMAQGADTTEAPLLRRAS
jgi:hypothetical protein